VGASGTRRRPAASRYDPGMDREILRLRGVDVRRGPAAILEGVDWTVAAGERWVVIGPNGAGKSTLLAVAATTLFPSTGSVRVLGGELGAVDARALRGRIGVASALLAGRLEPAQSALEVVLTGRSGALAPWWDRFTPADHTRAAGLLARLGVDRLGERTFGTLSTGERQRVLLARALMPDPDLVLVDEPAAGLDLRAREELVDALRAMAGAARPAAIVLVTHHLEEVPPGFGHAMVLAGGRVVAAGPVAGALTDAALTAAYGIPLHVTHAHGRWAARRA
jgi:iron complex transport system ATP-binding protein